MIVSGGQINIMDMVDSEAVKMATLKRKAAKVVKIMSDEGKSDEEIEAKIRATELPLGIHLAVMGSFSELKRYGRFLTRRERQVFNS